jgi:hypothetical protein
MKNYKLLVLLLVGFVFILGCGKPTTPDYVTPDDLSGGYKIINTVTTYGYASDVLLAEDLLYVSQGEGGLMILDATDRTDPRMMSSINDGVRGYSDKVAKKDSAIFLSAGGFGVNVVDAGNPYNPEASYSNLPMKPAKGFHIIGDYLFTAISEQGVKITDISYPTQPDPRGSISTLGYAQGLTSTPDTAYLLVACGEVGMTMIDISDFEGGNGDYPQVGFCHTPGYAEEITLLDEDKIAFMACGTSGLQVIDYSDTTNIHIVGSFDGPGYARALMYKDQKIFMCCGLGGFQVFDVSNYTSPKMIGILETTYASGVDMDDNYIYVADEENGLLVITPPQ